MNYRSYGGGGLGDDDQFGEHRLASAFQQSVICPVQAVASQVLVRERRCESLSFDEQSVSKGLLALVERESVQITTRAWLRTTRLLLHIFAHLVA